MKIYSHAEVTKRAARMIIDEGVVHVIVVKHISDKGEQ